MLIAAEVLFPYRPQVRYSLWRIGRRHTARNAVPYVGRVGNLPHAFRSVSDTWKSNWHRDSSQQRREARVGSGLIGSR
jgi:hypothetical protein